MEKYFSLLTQSPFTTKIGANLKADLAAGHARYSEFNSKRLLGAFDHYTPNMKKALFEIIFFLHYNDPKFEKLYVQSSGKGGSQPLKFDLFQQSTPAGVMGFSQMPAFFRKEMQDYIFREFQINLATLPRPAFPPITSVSSLGSIGTIAHKYGKSDLDLQIQFDLYPYRLQSEDLSDGYFKQILTKVEEFIKTSNQKRPGAVVDFSQRIPLLTRLKASSWPQKDVPYPLASLAEHFQAVREMVMVYDFYQDWVLRTPDLGKNLDVRLSRRIKILEEYIQAKFPDEEVHFFAYTTHNYRRGKHGSTVENKESSGSAYEMILTYDTLLPGIQYTPVVPTHFLFSEKINNSLEFYNSLIACLRLQLFDSTLKESGVVPDLWVDLGNTPFLTDSYLVAHKSAIYWEAFKGSSGNLPKAFLNLLRLESLNHPQYRHTIIQLIKSPQIYTALFLELKNQADLKTAKDPYFLNYDERDPFPLEEIFAIELKNPDLEFDPWWLRYKVLKIFYHQENDFDVVTRRAISIAIDFCFALHIGLDDVILNEALTKQINTKLRSRVLLEFLNNAFPPLTEKRGLLENIFLGAVTEVSSFEKTLKTQFKEVIQRLNAKITENVDQAIAEEKNIWYKYYEYNFEPKKGQIQKNILAHLSKSKGRLQIFFEENQWYFTSIKSSSFSGKRFDTFGTLQKQHQDKTELYVDNDLVRGLVYCIINGYYGAYKRQAIKTSATLIELLNFPLSTKPKQTSNLGRINSYLLEKLAIKLTERFPAIEVDYKESIQSAKNTHDVLLLINMTQYGRVHIIYRDKMSNFFLFYQDNLALIELGQNFVGHMDQFLKNERLVKSIQNLVRHCRIAENPAASVAESVSFWLNPLSIEHENAIREENLEKMELKVQEVLRQTALKPFLPEPQEPVEAPAGVG